MVDRFPHLNWKDVCLSIYTGLLDAQSREFLFCIIHNCLTVNQNMYLWNLCETCLCPCCNNTSWNNCPPICVCPVTLTFYLSICKWMESCQNEMPRNTVEQFCLVFCKRSILIVPKYTRIFVNGKL